MKTLKTRCDLCSCDLQWPASKGVRAGLDAHYDTVHPLVAKPRVELERGVKP